MYRMIYKKNKIVGIVCAIDPTIDLSYDYSKLESISYNYKYTINNYVKPIINEVVENKYMYIVNCCIDEDYRGNKIGSRMLRFFIEQMHEAGYEDIGFDCLMHNLSAKNLYHTLGFKEVSEGIGFDGTPYSTVETVFFKKKSTPFTKEDFQNMPDYNTRKNDEAREKIIFENISKKKELYDK